MLEHYLSIEYLGVFLSIGFIILNANGNIFSWPLGILASAIYSYIFFNALLYGDMILQVFYVLAGVYGWFEWNRNKQGSSEFEVLTLSKMEFLKLILIGLLLTVIAGSLLMEFTDSDIPFWDSFTTVFGFIATLMMAKRYLGNWIIWIFIDALCVGIYMYKNLKPTAGLYLIYTAMAIYGYYNWRKSIVKENAKST